MRRIILLDSTPLGILANPNPTRAVTACKLWAASLAAAGHRIIVPEIADYEVRRALCLGNAVKSLALLDDLATTFEYLPLTTAAMRLAAELWARARQLGTPTAGAAAIDGDVILAAQSLACDPTATIATANVAHLGRYAPAELWVAISP